MYIIWWTEFRENNIEIFHCMCNIMKKTPISISYSRVQIKKSGTQYTNCDTCDTLMKSNKYFKHYFEWYRSLKNAPWSRISNTNEESSIDTDNPAVTSLESTKPSTRFDELRPVRTMSSLSFNAIQLCRTIDTILFWAFSKWPTTRGLLRSFRSATTGWKGNHARREEKEEGSCPFLRVL